MFYSRPNIKGFLLSYMSPFMWDIGIGSNPAQDTSNIWKKAFN